MKRMSVAALVVSFGLISRTSASSEIDQLDLLTLQARSSLVVMGYAIGARTVRSDSVLEKEATIAVISVLFGSYDQPTLKLHMRSGLVFFDRLIATGDSGVFFLKPRREGGFEAAYPGSFSLFQKEWVKKLEKQPRVSRSGPAPATASAPSVRFEVRVADSGETFEEGRSLLVVCSWKNTGSAPVTLSLKDHDAYHGTLEYPLGLRVRVESVSGKVVTRFRQTPWPDEEWWTWYVVWSTDFQPEMPGDDITILPGAEVIRQVPLATVLRACPGLSKGLQPGRYRVQFELCSSKSAKHPCDIRSNTLPIEVRPLRRVKASAAAPTPVP